ncbi:MAG: hypothetical protein ACTHOO_10655 [Alcanivorax sp.]
MNEEKINIEENGLYIPNDEIMRTKINIANSLLQHQRIDFTPQIPYERQGEICLLNKNFQDYLEDSNLGVIEGLLSNWGGEIIHYMIFEQEELLQSLRNLSRAYEISVDTDLIDSEHCYFSEGQDEGDEYRYDIHIPPTAILEIKEINTANII